MRRHKPAAPPQAPRFLLLLATAAFLVASPLVSAATCGSDLFDAAVARQDVTWNAKRGPYTYIDATAASRLTRFGDTTLRRFEVEFWRPGAIHLQLWTRVDGNAGAMSNRYRLKYDQLFSAADAGMHELDGLDWDITDDDYWGFSYESDDEIPVRYVSESRTQAVSDERFFGGIDGLQSTRQSPFAPSQDAPKLFHVRPCTETNLSRRAEMMRSGRAGARSYTCERNPSWEDAADLYPGQVTYINGKKVNTPAALLKDLEVQMEAANFITIQIWRKDPANFEFLLVREKTFYAKSGYNSLPVNIQMQYGDQWGFSLSSSSGNQILYKNVTSDSSYFFPEFVSGVGSKRSYASIAPTPMEFKVSACIEVTPMPNGPGAGYNPAGPMPSPQQQQQQGFYAGGNYQWSSSNGVQNNFQTTSSGNNNAYGSYGVGMNPASQNPVTFPAAYGPTGGAQNLFFPQQSATTCYCTDNTFWYSASETLTGPYTYINPDPFTEQNANIEAFEIEAHRPGLVTLQVWRPAGPGMNALYLVWEKEVMLRPGYQRINLAHTVMAGDRWGFMSKLSEELPIRFYNDESSFGHEFSYQVSASTGQQIYLSSAVVTFKKFKLRPCLCSFMNGMVQLGAGMPYGNPYTTLDGINSGLNVYTGTTNQNMGPNQPANQQQPDQNSPMWGNNFGFSTTTSQNTNSMNMMSSSNNGANCMGKNVQSGQCFDCGNLDTIGPYTYINFRKLPRGRVESVDFVARNAGSVMLQIWRFDAGAQRFKVLWEKPVGLQRFPAPNTVRVNREVQENDLIGFSYLGSGVVPVQYANEPGTQAFEEATGRSTVMGNAEIAIPTTFSSKNFNMKVCFTSTSFQTQSSQSLNNYQSQPQYYQNLQFSNSQNGGGSTFVNNQQQQQSTSSMSQGIQSMIQNLLMVLNQGMSAQNINDLQTSEQSTSGGSSMSNQYDGCTKIRDGEATADAVYDDEIRGPYTYVADLQGVGGQCVKYVDFRAHSFEPFSLIRVRPNMGNFQVVDEIVVQADSVDTMTRIDVSWCLEANERIGFYYGGASKVPVRFTYSWGNAQELPQDTPVDGMITTLFETSKSFELCVYVGERDAMGDVTCPATTQNSGYNQFNSNYNGNYQSNMNNNNYNSNMQGGYNGNYQFNGNNNNYNSNPQGGWNNNFNANMQTGWSSNSYQQQQQQQQMQPQYTSFGANANANYNSGQNAYYPQYYGANGPRQQRLYLGPGSAFTPLLDQTTTQLDEPSCIGAPIDTRMSLAGFVYATQSGGSYLVPTGFKRPGRLSHVELEASRVSRVTIVHFGRVRSQDGQQQVALKNAIDYNLYPGINRIAQQYIDWAVEPDDVIGFLTEERVSPITYFVGADGAVVFNFNACVEDRLYNSPTTYQYPGQNGAFTGAAGANGLASPMSGGSAGGSCSCYDNAHWPFAFEEVYGPYTYINGEDFRQVSGFIQAFEIEAAISGTVTLHIWRKSSPYSDRLTKIWSQSVNLQAGYQRINGINFNIQDGDLWGMTFNSNGKVPINFLTDTNYYGYEIKDPASVSMSEGNTLYLSSANLGFKRFKIKPCICTYQTQTNVNEFGSGFMNQIGGTSTNNNYGSNMPQVPLNYYQQPYGSNQNMGYMNQQGPSYNYNTQFNTDTSSQFINQPMVNYAQQASMAPQYPTNTYQYCYGALDKEGYLVKFGPYTHINFEPLPEGVIENIEFEATRPGSITWLLWRYDDPSSTFKVVYEKEISFQSGKQSAQLMLDTQDRDMIGFYYGSSDEIPIKFSSNVGAQSYEDVSPSPPIIGTSILPPNDLEDKLFNYKVCMYSVTNDAPLPTTSNIGGYGYTYSEPTAPYYASGQNFGSVPGFGPSPNPSPGYNYNNNYFPSPTYGISQYDPVQAYSYDHYANPSPLSPSYGSSMSYQQQTQSYNQPGTPYGYYNQPWQNQYQGNN